MTKLRSPKVSSGDLGTTNPKLDIHTQTTNMRVLSSFVSSLLLSGATIVSAASSWSFDDATVSVTSKGADVGSGSKDK